MVWGSKEHLVLGEGVTSGSCGEAGFQLRSLLPPSGKT